MALVIAFVRIDGRSLAFTWFVPLGVAITLLVGGVLSTLPPAPVAGSSAE